MVDKPLRFIVKEHPPWYLTSGREDAFSCESTQGLFDKVAQMMICKQEGLSERKKRSKPKTIYKTIRDLVIEDADNIKQKPSFWLLLALMDLVDIEGGKDFGSIESVDKAGVKHELLANNNYTALYIPNKELTITNGKKVIPVVTHCLDSHVTFYDSIRSMIGTYIVDVATPGKINEKSYFFQEVLSVPGLDSLELLKRVTGNKFDFWDMSLEVPSHPTALTPSFQQIQAGQLLRTEDQTLSTQSNNDELVSQMDEIRPMCCVLGPASGEMVKTKREGSMDCFTEHQIICDLKHFHYENGGTRAVYSRRSSKLLDGKRLNVVPVVALKRGQDRFPVLYVSTTLRFCRAVKECSIKGNGDSVSCWYDTLQDVKRKTFITRSDMCQEIYQTALTAFNNRVNPSSWCNSLPKHVESRMSDPIMVEVVELAIRFMDSKIPNAFAVAELLYSDIDEVECYMAFWNKYSSDKSTHKTVQNNLISRMKEQMTMDWASLAHTASSYAQKRYVGKESIKKVSECRELFKPQNVNDVGKIQKKWQALVKFSNSKVKDKELVQLFNITKVLFLKLRTYHNKCKKDLKVGEGKPSDTQNVSSSTCSIKAQHVKLSSTSLTGVKEHRGDKAMAGDSEKNDSLFSIVTPEPIPISTWIRNMSTLLLSEPWLNCDDNASREAVCTLLGLDKTLLHDTYSAVLRDWVITNRTVVDILQQYGLEDRLSKALVKCLKSTSTDIWRRKILLAFKGTKNQQSVCFDQQVANPYSKMNPSSQSDNSNVRSKSVGKSAKKEVTFHHPKAVNLDRSASKTNKSSASTSSNSKSEKKARDSRADSPCLRRSQDKEDTWQTKIDENEDEEESYDEDNGEHLDETKEYDNSERLEQNYLSDDFIDDTQVTYSKKIESSDEDEADNPLCAKLKWRAKQNQCKAKKVNQGSNYKTMSHSEKEDYHTKPACSDMKEGTRRKKRTLQDESEGELFQPDVKRFRQTEGNRQLDKNKEKLSRSVEVVTDRCDTYSERADKTRTKERKDKSDRISKEVKFAKNTTTPNLDSPLNKSELSDSDTSDYKRKDHCLGGTKGVKPSKTQSSLISATESKQEERRAFKEIQTGRPEKTQTQKLKKAEPEETHEQQAVFEKQVLVNHPVAKSSHHSPGASQSQEWSSSGEAATKDKLTDQAVGPTNNLYQLSSDSEGEGEDQAVGPTDTPNQLSSDSKGEGEDQAVGPTDTPNQLSSDSKGEGEDQAVGPTDTPNQLSSDSKGEGEDQAVGPTDTPNQLSSDSEGEGQWDSDEKRLDREVQQNQYTETKPASDRSKTEDTDLESDCSDTPGNTPDKAGSSSSDTDSNSDSDTTSDSNSGTESNTDSEKYSGKNTYSVSI